jgi:hypothetical protein
MYMIENNSCLLIRVITKITAACCLLSMALCYKLWLGERNFPVVPVFDFLPRLQHPFDFILPAVAFVLLLCIVFFRYAQKLIIAYICISILLSLLDLNRWQPWFYQYLMMFVALSFYNFRCDNVRLQNAITGVFKIMIAAIYFWSGLHKLNPRFLSDTFPWLMEPVMSALKIDTMDGLIFLGKGFPLFETLTGICLLIPPIKKAAVICAVLMHVFILFVLSPFGHNYNPVVWPWNIAMILFVILLFFNDSKSMLTEMRTAFHYTHLKIVIALFVLMPLLNCFNLWDSYLSHNLYSGNTSNGDVYFTNDVKEHLASSVQSYVVSEPQQNTLNIKYWCIKELGVPAYPEKRNFEAITKTFYKYAKDSSEVYLVYNAKLKAGE